MLKVTTFRCLKQLTHVTFLYKLSKLSKFCLESYNLQNTAVKVIIIKRLLRVSSSRTEVSLRLTIPRNPRTCTEKLLQGGAIQQHCRQSNIDCCANNTMQRRLRESLKIMRTVIPRNTSYK